MSKKTGILSVTLVAGLATGLLAPQYTGLSVKAAPSLDPYSTVQAEINFERDVKETYTENDGATQGVSLESGNYFKVKSLNFSQGVSRIGITVKADTMGKLEIHKGDKNGELLGSIKINKTNGEYKNFESPISGLDGTETITFVQTSGSSMIDSWYATPSAITEQPGVTVEQPASEDPSVNDTESRYDKVEAESCSKSDKAMTTPNKKAVMITEGQYVLAKDVDFSEGLAGFYVNAGSSAPKSSLSIYIDDIQGDAVATLTDLPKDTAELSAKFASDIKGKHDVYFVSSKNLVTIDSWQAIKANAEATSEQPVVEEPTSEEPVVEQPTSEEPVVAGTVNAYELVQAEDSSDFKDAMVAPGKKLVSIQPGGYIVIDNVDFSKGTDGILVYAKTEVQPKLKLNVYLDDMNGKPISTLNVHGYADITATGGRISADIKGTHKLYIVADKDNPQNITVDSWMFTYKKQADQPVVEEPTSEQPVVEQPTSEQPVVGDTVNPYEKVEAEKSTKIENGMKTPSKNAVLLRKDGYIYIKDVDFSKGLDGFFVDIDSSVKSVINVYLDDMSGKELAQIVVTPDKKTNGVKLSSDVKGVHDVYFVVKGESITIDSWNALQGHQSEQPTSEQPVVEQPVVGDTVNPYENIQVESSSDLKNARISPNKKEVAIQPGGYVVIDNVNFSNGSDGIMLSGRGGSKDAKLMVYLDDMNGKAITTVPIKSDAENKIKNVDSAGRISSSTAVKGVHKVYLVAEGSSVTLDYFRFTTIGTSEQPTSEQPVVEQPSSDKVNPYNKVEAESSSVLKNADTTSDKKAVTINVDGYVVAKNVDFSKGFSGIAVNVQKGAPKATIDVYVDKMSGTPIATLGRFTMTGGEYKAEFASDIKGTHDVYFVVKGNPVTVDSWYAMASGSVAEDPVVAKKVDPYNTVEAETSAELKNAELTGDKTAVNVSKDGYIVAKNADFSKGISGFAVIAASSSPNTSVKVYVDKMSGTPIATLKVTSMGQCKLVSTQFNSNIKGNHDVYIAADGKAFTIDAWYAVQAKDQPTSEEPKTEQPKTEQPKTETPIVQPSKTGMKLTDSTNAWPGGYLTNFFVQNDSGKTVDTWKLKIKKKGIKITQSWCVNIETVGDYYVITPLSWNSKLTNGQSIQFGIIADGEPTSKIDYVFE